MMLDVNAANKLCENTLMPHLGIEFTQCETERVEATMVVTQNHTQPMGLLHGGATLALAESVGSVASAMLVGTEAFAVVGLNMSANHIKSAVVGETVTAVATVVHQGRSTHVWNIDIHNEDNQLISSCRLTNFIKPLS